MKWMFAIRKALHLLLPRSKISYRFIWLGCIVVSVPIVLAASMYYQYSMKKLTDQFREDSKASVAQLKDRMEGAFMAVEYESLQLAANPVLRNALTAPGFESDYITQQQILDFLSVHKNSSDLVEEIIWYAASSDLVLTNAYGSVKLDGFPQKEAVRQSLAADEQAGWTYLGGSPESNPYISFVRKLPVMSIGEPEGVLIVHVRREALTRLMASHMISLQSQTLAVLDYENRVLLHSADPSLLGRPADREAAFEPVIGGGATSGTLITDDSKGEKHLTVFQKSAYGRNYVSFLPEREMIRQLTWIRVFVAYSLIVTLIVGLLLMFIVSRMAYSPIDQLVKYGETLRKEAGGQSGRGNELEFIRSSLEYLNQQAEQLNNYVRKIKPDLRDRFLLRLIRGAGPNREAIEESCRTYDIPTRGLYAVLAVKVENLYKEKRFLPEEGAVIVFAVRNIMMELLDKESRLRGYILEWNERENVAVLFAEPDRGPAAFVSDIRAYVESARSALLTVMSFHVSVGIGSVKDDVSMLSESHAEAVYALHHRLFHDTGPVLMYEDIVGLKRPYGFNYPKVVEENILSALSAGDLKSAEQGLDAFYERVRASESFKAMQQSYQVLLSSILRSLEEVGPGVMELAGVDLFEQMMERQTYSEVHDWFVETLFPMYVKVTEDIRKNSAKASVHQLLQHIRSNPGAPHTLTECAEMVGMSPSHLSRIFKQEVGVSFIEYIMECKVEEAKRLLSGTDRSITDIAREVGYSERNLNRAFQRYVGMSPKQYRLSLR